MIILAVCIVTVAVFIVQLHDALFFNNFSHPCR